MAPEEEECTGFWELIEQYDNVGFTRAAGGAARYLVCADCAAGPVGYASADTGCSYIAHARIKFIS